MMPATPTRTSAKAVIAAIAVAGKFILELAALLATGYWAYVVTAPSGFRWLAALLVPAVVAMLWAVFIAPRSPRKLPLQWRIAAELAVFAAASLALWVTLGGFSAMLMAAVALAITALLLITDSYADASRSRGGVER